ncbi:YvcK family protein [Candidatus Microgenomates bacterium]|nr:YvcK family protein [Candidatus Microgenomates bacterium]
MLKEKIVTVGGGSGSPIVNEALFLTGQVDEINAIAAVFDSGGATGRRRLDSYGNEIAYSDPMRIFRSLCTGGIAANSLETLDRWLTHRDIRGKVLGQEIFNHFFSSETGFAQIEEDAKAFGFDVRGHVLPASTKPADINFVTRSGREFFGEHELDGQRMSKDMVAKISLTPEVPANEKATTAIRTAALIFLSCGSFYGSVLSNFLPIGMKEALRETPAKIYLVTNLVSTRSETHRFTPGDFIHVLEKHLGRKPDGLIVPNISRHDFERQNSKVARRYSLDGSFFLGWDQKQIASSQKNLGLRIVTHDATNIVETSDGPIVRHDPARLAETLKALL